MANTSRTALIGFALFAAASFAFATPIVHTSDFIPDNARTHFNGFEAIPTVAVGTGGPYYFYAGGNGPYVEDGISVRQVNGDAGNDIWVNGGGLIYEGSRSWYPNGGTQRNSYVEITMADGSAFSNFGFYLSAGGFVTQIYFDLLSNGVSVLSGSIAPPPQWSYSIFEYLGFSGGGFDTIRVRDNLQNWPALDRGTNVYDGWTSLMIDALETGGTSPASVPEPRTALIFALGLAALQFTRRGSTWLRVLRR
jgi:hypothetical protein